jgi:hypothetical protein
MKLQIHHPDLRINESMLLSHLILNNDIEPALTFPIEEMDLNELIIYIR